MPTDLIYEIQRALGLRQPDAVSRFTREPIYFTDELIPLQNGSAEGYYNPDKSEIEVSRKAKNKNKTIKHESLHSLFGKTNVVDTLQKQSPTEIFRTIPRDQFEHMMIDMILGDQPIHRQGSTAKIYNPEQVLTGDIRQAILAANQNREIQQLLERILR